MPENRTPDEDFYLARYMLKRIAELNPKMKMPDLKNWTHDVRLIRKEDNRTHKEIKMVFDWANNDPFWQSHILSPSKLRDQFDKLFIKSKEAANNGNKQQDFGSRSEPIEINAELDRIASEDIKKNGFHSQLYKPTRKQHQRENTENTLFTLGEFYDNPPPEPEIFWRDAALFRGARMVIVGGAKKGKSSFAMHLGKAAATGGKFLGHSFTKPLKVVWLQAEIQKKWLKSRFDQMRKSMTGKEFEMMRQNFFASGRLRIDAMNPEQWDNTIELLSQINPDIVIIDPVINFFPGGNENDNSEMHRLLERFDTLEDHFDCAIIALHHTGKNTMHADPFDAIRGASAIRGWYDTGIVLSACKGAPLGTVTISYELRNGAPLESHAAIYNHADGEWQGTLQKQYEEAVKPAKDLQRLDSDHNKNVLLNIIKDNGGVLSKQIIELAKDQAFLIKGKMDRYSVRALKDLVSEIKNHKNVTTAKHGASVRHFYKSEVEA